MLLWTIKCYIHMWYSRVGALGLQMIYDKNLPLLVPIFHTFKASSTIFIYCHHLSSVWHIFPNITTKQHDFSNLYRSWTVTLANGINRNCKIIFLMINYNTQLLHENFFHPTYPEPITLMIAGCSSAGKGWPEHKCVVSQNTQIRKY